MFFYTVKWSEAAAIHRELDERYIPHRIESQPPGEVVFLFDDEDIPPRFYVVVREILGSNGTPIEKWR